MEDEKTGTTLETGGSPVLCDGAWSDVRCVRAWAAACVYEKRSGGCREPGWTEGGVEVGMKVEVAEAESTLLTTKEHPALQPVRSDFLSVWCVESYNMF